MIRIIVNNTTVTEKQAINDAYDIYDQTGEAVEVCNSLGDTILYLHK